MSNNSPPSGSSSPASTDGTRKYLIGGNWKSNLTTQSVNSLVALLNAGPAIPNNTEVVVAVPHPYLSLVKSTLRSDISVAAQDCSAFGPGAHTGEVNCDMLLDLGVEWVVLGHSERREAGESNETVAVKAKLATSKGLKVMVCCGEKLEDRTANNTMSVVASQLAPVLKADLDWSLASIAYEPVWAIGTGKTATPAMAQETHEEIRGYVSSKLGPEVADGIRIQVSPFLLKTGPSTVRSRGARSTISNTHTSSRTSRSTEAA